MDYHIKEDDPRSDFVSVRKFLCGLGLDVGPGTNKLSPNVLCTDWYPHIGVDLVWNCVDGGGRYHYPFSTNTFDFIFASHVIEDFDPSEIQFVFDELMRMIKPGGYFVILIPDMQNKRYPDWNEVFKEDHPDVLSGKRQVGQLIGNPSHKVTAGSTLMHHLKNNSQYKSEIVQEDTIPHSSMSLDFVVKKL